MELIVEHLDLKIVPFAYALPILLNLLELFPPSSKRSDQGNNLYFRKRISKESINSIFEAGFWLLAEYLGLEALNIISS